MARQFEDLTGRRFTKLLVLSRDLESKGIYWVCKCDCGNTKNYKTQNLKEGHAKSCGCLLKEKKHFVGEIINNHRLKKKVIVKSTSQQGKWEMECIICGKTRTTQPSDKSKCQRCKNNKRKGWEIEDSNLQNKYLKYITGAVRRDYKFRLSPQQFTKLCLSNCYYCGDVPKPYNGIDRVKNDIGYLPENCVPCCTTCNRMKMGSSEVDFVEQCRKVAFTYQKGIQK